MEKEQRQKLTEMIETFVRICNKYTAVSSRPLDYGSGDLLFPSEIHMLNHISIKREQSISEIGRYFGISRSAASQTVMKLEKKGFCTKSKKINQRNIYIELTDKGKRALNVFLNYKNNIFNDLIEVFESTSKADIKVIDRVFFSLEKHMDKMNM